MILVLFEVTIRENCMDGYLAMVEKLKDRLSQATGFIRSDRFTSFVHERKLLSISIWETEEAVTEWRNQHEHRQSQQVGRDSIFESYSITVASPLRTYTDQERGEAPSDSNTYLFTL